MNVKNIVVITLVLVILSTIGAVSASQDNITVDELTTTSDDIIESSIDEDVAEKINNEMQNESKNLNDNDALSSSGSFVDVSEAYKLLNSFRTEENVWYWNSDDTTKTVFNTDSSNQLKTLTRDADLEKTAQIRAKELCEKYSHTRPDGTTCFTAYPDDLTAAGENIAYGQRTCNEVTEDWKETNDPYSGQGHRRNMLSQNFNCVGIAGFKLNGVIYWVQAFGYRDHINTNYDTASNNNHANTQKVKTAIKASGKIKFKAKAKIKKYTVTLKAGKKVIKKVQVTLKIGKKLYKVKTNTKGKATFKIKLNKKGKYTGKVTFNGNSNYLKSTKTVKIIIK